MMLKTWTRRIRHHLVRLGLAKPPHLGIPDFTVEQQLLDGVHYTTNTHRSILHFSIHKSATQYVKNILARCAGENGLQHVRMNEYCFFKLNTPYLHTLSAEEMTAYQHVFRPQGYIYSVFAGMLEGLQRLDDYHCVLMVRDPRDTLTSAFFSIAYSHRPPEVDDKRQSFLETRQWTRQNGIDAYVLWYSNVLRAKLQRYLDELVPRANVYVTKYEEMIADFPSWLDGLLQYCELPISAALKRELIAEAEAARPAREDIHNHVRQVMPGDHRRKLLPETITQLNETFADVLRDFGYEV